MRALFLVFLGLAGCAHQASYREQAASWIGKTERQLIRALGEPNSSITVPSGDTFDEYRDSGCTITFRIDSRRVVVSADWKGGCA